MKLLIIEDEPTLLKDLGEFVAREGFSFLPANIGITGLKYSLNLFGEGGFQQRSEPVPVNFIPETGRDLNWLIAEKNNSQCDLFWSGDPLRNVVLQSKEITAPYQSAQTDLILNHFRDKEHHWTGFSARARVLIYNKTLISPDSLPKSILELTLPQYKRQFGIANPLFGTTTFHIAALFAVLGNTTAEQWMDDLLSRQTEAKLAISCAQMPLIAGTEVPEIVPSLDHIIPMKIDYSQTSELLEKIQPWLKKWVEE